ncbi:hypothetical protein [Leptolyngbya ohadii]|nr:hypothetical protein [Leptolyngbya ohadii]
MIETGYGKYVLGEAMSAPIPVHCRSTTAGVNFILQIQVSVNA